MLRRNGLSYEKAVHRKSNMSKLYEHSYLHQSQIRRNSPSTNNKYLQLKEM